MEQTFIRFLNLKNALEVDPTELDSISIKLLEFCQIHHHSGHRMKVTDIMKNSMVASPLTIHRKLAKLIGHGYLCVQYDQGNHKRKFLVPTQKAHDYFAKLGELIVRSAAGRA